MKKILIVIIALIAVGGGAFYYGMKYRESKIPQKPQIFGANASSSRNQTGKQQMAGSVSGEIIAKDDKSVTINLRAGGSRIVFFADSTEIVKSASGTQNDLEIGKSVVINGKANQDGSITAESIQLRSNPLK